MGINRKKITDLSMLVIADLAGFLVSITVAAVWLCGWSMAEFVRDYSHLVLTMGVVVFASLYMFDLYYTLKDFRRYWQVINLIMASIASFCMLVLFSGFDPSQELTRGFLFLFTVAMFAFVFVNRVVFSLLRVKVFYRNAVILGGTAIAKHLVNCIRTEKQGQTLLC